MVKGSTMSMKRKLAAAGFTLSEVMVAMFIFALGSAAIGILSLSIVRLNGFAAEVSSAMGFAESKVEELRAMDYAAVGSGSDTVPGYARTWLSPTSSASDQNSRGSWRSRHLLEILRTS